MPLPGFWRFAWHLPCVTGALPAVALVLNPKECVSAYILSPGGPFKQSLLHIWQFLLQPQSLLVFTARIYGDLSSWCWNPGLCSLGWGWDCCLPRYPSQFLPTTRKCWTALSVPAAISAPRCVSSPLACLWPLQPVWMNVASLNPWLSGFHTVQFSDCSGCYL